MAQLQHKKLDAAWFLVLFVPAIFIFAAYEWLNTSDGYGTYVISGKEVLHRMPHSFWVWVWLGLAGFLLFGFIAYLNESGTWLGKYMTGNTGLTILLIIMALGFLIGPWIRAGEAKANGGATDLPAQTSKVIYENTRYYPATDTHYYWCDGTISTYGIPVKGYQNA